jgi:hypothetical protein
MNPEDAYRKLFERGYIETGPKLVSQATKTYRSYDPIFETAEPYMARIANGQASGLVDVPGPYHAVAVAMSVQQKLLDQDEHVIFRGQSNSSYPLIASIFRPGIDRAAEDRANRLIAWFLASTAHQFYGVFGSEMFLGAAQHYKGRTPLIDFTPDPSVAVWFASQPRTGRSECETASVWIMRLDSARQFSTRIVLPPPFVERLYRQRGMFIERASGDPLRKETMIEIRFPANLTGSDYRFDVIRQGRRVNIFEDHSWIRGVVNWAIEAAKDSSLVIPNEIPQMVGYRVRAALDSPEEDRNVPKEDTNIERVFKDTGLYLKGLKACGLDRIFHDLRTVRLERAQWLDSFNDYIYWMAMRFTSKFTYFSEKHESKPMESLIEQNLALAKEYLRMRTLFLRRDIEERGLPEGSVRAHLAAVSEAIRAVETR